MNILWIIAALAGGYVASIYTWPKVKVWVNGAETEIAKLKAYVKALEARIKG